MSFELPKRGTLESPTLDFKCQATTDAIERAKDLAAFANALGGRLLIGACGGTALGAYKPLSAKEATRVQGLYESAARDRCRPVPVFAVERVKRSKGFVVVVEVQAFPGQPVGVRLEHEGAYFFPVRVGTQTQFITPEQLATR